MQDSGHPEGISSVCVCVWGGGGDPALQEMLGGVWLSRLVGAEAPGIEWVGAREAVQLG